MKTRHGKVRVVTLAAIAMLLVACGSSDTGADARPVLLLNQSDQDVIVQVSPFDASTGPTRLYQVPARGGGFLADDLSFFEGDVLDTDCSWIVHFNSDRTYANVAFTRVVLDPWLVVSIDPVATNEGVDPAGWGNLPPTTVCPEQ